MAKEDIKVTEAEREEIKKDLDAAKPGKYESDIRSRIFVGRENESDRMFGSIGQTRHDPDEKALGLRRQYDNPLTQGIVWSEILGPPLCKRKGRGRRGI